MRIALLTALAEHPERAGHKAAFRTFVGRSVLSHQIDCAKALDCDIVLCMIRGLGPEAIVCQHRAERLGMRFRAIEDLRRLSGAISADDRVIVIADGLALDIETARAAIGERPSVATFPADLAVPHGFERIDAERAWAGLLSIRGEAIERLADLPSDADAASSLLRIALQSGVRTDPLDPELMEDMACNPSEDEASLAARERRWIARRAEPVSFAAPGRAIAERIGIRLSRDVVGSRFERVPLFVAVAAGILAGVLAVFGKPLTGLLVSGVMALALPIADIVLKLARPPGERITAWHASSLLGGAGDVLFIGLLALASRGTGSWIDLFLPLVLIGLLRIGSRIAPLGVRPLLSDRIALLAVLVPAGYLGVLQSVIAMLALLVLAALFRATHSDRLTPP